jgi:hypothetical protein
MPVRGGTVNRRTALRLGGVALAGSVAGCAAVSGSPPDVDPHTGLDSDASAALDGRPVALAGDADALPTPPTRADSLDDAEACLATPDAPTAALADAFREGTVVAFAGDGASAALASLLDAVADDYHHGQETVGARPLGPAVAVPWDDTVDTFQFVRDGGWDRPVLDPVGWALHHNLPECDTFVPEHTADSQYEALGAAWLAGRLPTGETYAARTEGSRYAGDGDVRRLRLRTTVHAAATGGHAVAKVRRVTDFPNDASLADWFPNSHERGGVSVANRSDPVDERLDVTFSPADAGARGALTGCCRATVGRTLRYDHRTRWVWTREGLLSSDSRFGGGTGYGAWHVHP